MIMYANIQKYTTRYILFENLPITDIMGFKFWLKPLELFLK